MKKVLCLFLLAAAGCSGRQAGLPEAREPNLTGHELLYALGGDVFEVVVPAHVTPQHMGGLAIRFADGRLVSLGSGSGYKPNTRARVVLLQPEANVFSYTVLYEGASIRYRDTNFPLTTPGGHASRPQKTGVAAGDWLVRYSKDGHVKADAERATEDDFDILFQFELLKDGERSAKPSSADSH